MSNISRFTELRSTRTEDVEEVVSFYNQEIEAIHSDKKRMTMWSPFTGEQITDIIENPHSDLLLLREKLGETAVGAIVGGVIVDEDFSAWPPLEVYSQKPRHFGKFLAKQGLGRSALWPALLQYGESNGISMYAAEAWDFTYDGLPKDNLKEYYTSLGMEWHGTVIYRNKYYDNSVIGDKRPVNRFLYRLDSQPPRP